MNNTIFAERLREARTAAKLTQAQLSMKAGVTAATISAYESADGNKGKNPSLENALKLAQALNVSLDWLCGFSVRTEKAPIVDFLKLLVTLDEYTCITFDKVDLLNKDVQAIMKEAYSSLNDDELYMNHCYCEENNEREEWNVFASVFHDYHIERFIREWQKMRELYRSNTIDKDLYNLWLNKQFLDIEKQMNERLICITGEIIPDGEQNGDDQETE